MEQKDAKILCFVREKNNTCWENFLKRTGFKIPYLRKQYIERYLLTIQWYIDP